MSEDFRENIDDVATADMRTSTFCATQTTRLQPTLTINLKSSAIHIEEQYDIDNYRYLCS
jgi:hypothetical protein